MKKADSREKELYEALLRLKSIEEYHEFLTDLCTPAELEALSDRWKVAQLLTEGLPYRSIYEKTGVSTATVTRVARSLEYGTGYKMLLQKPPQKPKKRAKNADE